MADSPNTDEQPMVRRSIRSCRLSVGKPKAIVEKKVDEPVANEHEMEEEEEEEDPPDTLQVGDVLWVRVSGNPWWPALVYGSHYEDNLHTKVLKVARRKKKRVYFVYFFGPSFEYVWTPTTMVMPYAGLEEFNREVELNMQKATTKAEQEAMSNRFEFKASGVKRVQWDQAVEEANEAIKLTREERIKNFEEILNKILEKAEARKSTKRRHTAIGTGPTRKTMSPPGNKSNHRSSVKRQKTNISPVSSSNTLLHVGLPTLTKVEEKRLVQDLLAHPKATELTLGEAQSFACQLVMGMIKENSQHEMSCVQVEWFYDFLIKHREIVAQYSRWFEDVVKPVVDDTIYAKQCQIRNMVVDVKN